MTLEVALWPIEDMSALGLYSGDTHMHDAHGPSAYTLDYTDALFFCEAEGMDVINCLDAGQFNATPYTSGRITSYNVCYTKLLRDSVSQ